MVILWVCNHFLGRGLWSCPGWVCGHLLGLWFISWIVGCGHVMGRSVVICWVCGHFLARGLWSSLGWVCGHLVGLWSPSGSVFISWIGVYGHVVGGLWSSSGSVVNPWIVVYGLGYRRSQKSIKCVHFPDKERCFSLVLLRGSTRTTRSRPRAHQFSTKFRMFHCLRKCTCSIRIPEI